MDKTIPIEEIAEMQEFIKHERAKDLRLWSCNLLNNIRLRLVYRPPTNKFIVFDLSGEKHAEWHFDTIEEAVEKYNEI